MTKYELMQYLREYVQAENKYFRIKGEVNEIKREIAKAKKPPILEEKKGFKASFGTFLGYWALFAIIAAVCLIVAIFILSIVEPPADGLWAKLLFMSVTFVHLEKHPFLFFILLALFISAFLSLWLTASKTRKYNKTYPERNREKIDAYEKDRARLPALEALLRKKSQELTAANNYFTMLKKRNILHPDYLQSAGTLLKYLERGRADSLKEALNLLEQERAEIRWELAREEHEAAMQEYAKAQAKALGQIADEAARSADVSERAAQHADDAAFWGAVSAFEIDKMRRDSKK